MEILDLIAKVSWDTNEKALSGISKEMAKQDKAVSELNAKNKRLQDQISRTNDPKRVKALNAEIEKTKKAVDRVSHAQAEQAIAVRRLSERHAELHRKMKETTDPKIYAGLKRELDSVDNKMKALTSRAGDAQSKFAGIGKGLLSGFGLGAGLFTLDTALRGIQNFVSSAISEFEDAERTASSLGRALKTVGKESYFNDLKRESESLAKTFGNLFDNDDIIKAQTAFINYGKVSRDEISKLLPVVIELAAAMANKTGGELDLASATEKVINMLSGRGGQTLREYGLSMKGVKTEHERMNLVLDQFMGKLNGSAKVYGETADGIMQKNRVLIADLQEKYGQALAELKKEALPLGTALIQILDVSASTKALTPLQFLLQSGASILGLKLFGSDEKKAAAPQKITGTNQKINPNAIDPEELEEQERKIKEIEDQKLADEKRRQAERDAQRKRVAKEKEEEAKRLAKVLADAQKYLSKVQSDFGSPKQLKNQLFQDPFLSDESMITDARNKPGGSLIGEGAVEQTLPQGMDPAAINDFYASLERARQEKITAETKKGVEERKRAYSEELFVNAQLLASNISDILGQDARRTSKQIELAEDRVEQARKSSDASVKIEEQRLEQLRQKRERYERAQRVIDAGVVVANQAVAISNAVRGITKAAAETGIAAPIGVAANVLAIASGIGAAIAAIRSINADAGFREGGYTGDGDPSKESTAIGRRPYKYHKREFVMNEGLTEKYRDMFEGMHRGKLVAQRMGDSWVLMPRTLDVDRAVSDHNVLRSEMQTANLEAALLSIDKRLSQREVIIKNNFDAEGFGVSVATQLGKAQIINKLRNS